MTRWLLRFSTTLVALLVVGELVVRLLLASPTAWEPEPTFGLWRVPGASIVQSSEGYGRYRVGPYGFVDGPTSGSRRALLLGDSFSLALQVGYGERFSERIEELTGDLDIRNAAFAGWYPAHYSLLAQNLDMSIYDLVIVQIADRDLFELDRDGRIRFEQDAEANWHLRADPFPTEKGALQEFVHALSRRFALVEFLRVRSQNLFHQERARLRAHFRHASAAPAGDANDETLPPDAAERLRFFHETLAPWHDRLIYLYLPRLNYEHRPPRLEWPECRELMQEFASETGAVLVDPTEKMSADFPESWKPVAGFHNSRMGGGHLNVHGHHLVAEALAEAMEEILR